MNSMIKSFDKAGFIQNWGWFLAWGLILFCLGLAAIGAAIFTTLLSVMFLGGLFIFGGVIIVIDSFHYWKGTGKSFYLNLLMGILYFAFGLMLIINPLVGAATLTLLLSVLFVLLGMARIMYASSTRFPQWGWMLFSGILTLVLGILIVVGWPASSLYVIGLFIGIDLVFGGWAYIMAALMGRMLVKKN
ncbi:HdeD family acid-resistance protein [Candidatus Berkiella aquae]|nr:DUF308 domain-containing protein [Candidatus Berkiella aquae]MCS5710089.1 DUF308 domain-containing protein [Candidatus Berkiella aquae]